MDKSLKVDITSVVDQYLCHSCGACNTACPKDCIDYNETIGGYFFPKIDYDICINCELCLRVCSGDHFEKTLKNNNLEDPFIGDIISTKVGKATDKEIFDNSQSGGVVTALLKNLLDTNQIELAIVATSSETIPPRGDFLIVRDSKDLLLSQKSKYVPITMLTALKEIKKIKNPFAIIGLSCHFHSLQNLADTFPWIRKKEIIKIGLICDRILTNKSIDFISNQATSENIKKIEFRNKLKPSYPGNPTVETVSGKEFILDKSVRMNMKDYFTPARCRLCFDKLNTQADIVVGDPHGIENTDKHFGESLIFSRSKKGLEVVEKATFLKDVDLRDTDTDIAIKGQRIDDKRKKWYAHYKAWEELGYDLPDYSDNVLLNSVKASNRDIAEAKEHFLQAFSLDKYDSKELLVKNANIYYRNRKIKSNIFKPLYLLKKIANRIIK